MTAHVDAHWHAATCAACHQPVDLASSDHVCFGEFWYHVGCLPTCRTCGQSVGHQEDEGTWSFRAHVISTAYGYAQRPTHFVCPSCLDGALLDEAPYLD